MKKAIILVIGITALIAVNALCLDINVMMPLLGKAKKSIAATLASIDKDLSITAEKLSSVDLKGEDARKILNELCQGRDYLVDCALIDPAGKMIVVEPAESGRYYEGSNISKQAHIAKFLRSKKPIFSDVFHSVEGIEVIDFDYPLFSVKGEFLGAVSMLVKQEALSGDIIVPLVKDMPCKAWVMQKDGLIIYDPDLDQIGRNIFVDALFQPFKDLVSFSSTVARAKDGAGSYDFYAKGLEDVTIVKKYAVWDTVSLYGTEWRIIVMEANKPAASAFEQLMQELKSQGVSDQFIKAAENSVKKMVTSGAKISDIKIVLLDLWSQGVKERALKNAVAAVAELVASGDNTLEAASIASGAAHQAEAEGLSGFSVGMRVNKAVQERKAYLKSLKK